MVYCYFYVCIIALTASLSYQSSIATVGNGIFGYWMNNVTTMNDILCYSYTLNQYQDERARWPKSVNEDRGTHWFSIGNTRINLLCSNDGLVQLYLGDRGGTIINKFGALDFELKPEQRNPGNYQPYSYSGGYGYLVDKLTSRIWPNAYRYYDDEIFNNSNSFSRLFCASNFNTTLFYNDIQWNQTIYAPDGDDPLLLVDISLTNNRSLQAKFDLYQYFDVNMYRIQLEWIRTGTIPASLGDQLRFELNKDFVSSIVKSNQTLTFHQKLKSKTLTRTNVTSYDPLPFDIFLTDLSIDSPSSRFSSKYFYEKKSFFGQGGAKRPDYLYNKTVNSFVTNDPMPYCLILVRELSLEPGETVHLRYAFGAVAAEESQEFIEKYRVTNLRTSLDALQSETVHFQVNPSDRLNINETMSVVFEREMSWHSVSLLQSTIYNEYFRTHLISQGSTYLYLHGLDGAPRDHILTLIVINYLKPNLSRDILILLMSQQNVTTGHFPYSFAGDGLIADALGLHEKPSDLDIYFLWGLAEYISATGNLDFLSKIVPFYCVHSRNESYRCLNGTVLVHAKLSYQHLIIFIGIGESGLLKLGDGDWDDGIVISTCLSQFGIEHLLSDHLTKDFGESIPNTQQALYVLPRIAAVVQHTDPQSASSLLFHVDGFREALVKKFNGPYFHRAVFKNIFNESIIISELNLQAQVWPLISRLAMEMGVEEQLIETIRQHLDDGTPNGAAMQPDGQVWPAISQLLTWAYISSNQPQLAWRSLYKNSFAKHAELFPEIWYNIWSGPDGINSRGK